MIRLSRLAEYAVLLMSHMAREPATTHTAIGMADATGLPVPTVSKILAMTSRYGLLDSIRGRDGGYRLARAPAAISVEDIIAAVDGPIALTVCIEQGPGCCELEHVCPSRTNWHRINQALRSALSGVTLAEMAAPAVAPADAPHRTAPLPAFGVT